VSGEWAPPCGDITMNWRGTAGRACVLLSI
jgi:hypothetical protein